MKNCVNSFDCLMLFKLFTWNVVIILAGFAFDEQNEHSSSISHGFTDSTSATASACASTTATTPQFYKTSVDWSFKWWIWDGVFRCTYLLPVVSLLSTARGTSGCTLIVQCALYQLSSQLIRLDIHLKFRTWLVNCTLWNLLGWSKQFSSILVLLHSFSFYLLTMSPLTCLSHLILPGRSWWYQ